MSRTRVRSYRGSQYSAVTSRLDAGCDGQGQLPPPPRDVTKRFPADMHKSQLVIQLVSRHLTGNLKFSLLSTGWFSLASRELPLERVPRRRGRFDVISGRYLTSYRGWSLETLLGQTRPSVHDQLRPPGFAELIIWCRDKGWSFKLLPGYFIYGIPFVNFMFASS